MNDYSHPKYKDLYTEILIDYHYRFAKFHPIPYPLLRKDLNERQHQSGQIAHGSINSQ